VNNTDAKIQILFVLNKKIRKI